ncbi:MAG: tetratricopeptide repeat protein [Promethearchaeota archaeon]
MKKLGPVFTPSYKFYHSTAAENYFQAIISMKVAENWLCQKLKMDDELAPMKACVPKVEGEIIQYLHGNPDWHEILYHFLQENVKLHYGNENWESSLYYLDEMVRLELPLNNRYYELKGATLQKMRKFDDALNLYEQALKINKESNNFYGQAVDLNHMGLIHRGLGEPEKAIMCYQEALLIHQETNNLYGKASVLSNIGSVEKNMGKFKDAIAHLQESFSLFNQLGKKKGISKNVRTIATILNTMGDTDNALNYAKQVALPIDESSNDKYSMSLDFDLLGKIYRRRREFYEAIASLKEALKLKEEIGNENGLATTLGELGRVYRQMKKLDDALDMCNQAFKIHSKYKNKHGKAYIQGTLGTIYKFKGDLDKSLNHYLAALEFHKEIKNKHGMAIEYRNVATIYNKKKRLNEAEQYYELALEADRDSQEITRDTQAITLGKLGIISRQKKNFEKSYKYHSEALALNEELQNIEGVARDLGNLGLNYWKWGKIDVALEYLNKAIQMDEENQFNRHLAEMYGNLGQLYMGITPEKTSNLEGAITNFQKSIQLKRRLENINPGSVTMDLINLGRAYSHTLINKNEMAAESFLECYKINLSIKNHRGNTHTLKNLSTLFRSIPHKTRISFYSRLYMIDRSVLNHREFDFFHKVKNTHDILKKRENLNELFEAEQLLYEFYSDTKQTGKKNEMLKTMGPLCVRLKKLDEGIKIYSELLVINKKSGNNQEVIRNLRTIATFHKQKENYLEQISCHKQALEIHEKANNVKEQAVDCNFLGNSYRYQGDKENALKWFKQTKSLHEKLGNTKLAENTQNIIRNIENSDDPSP